MGDPPTLRERSAPSGPGSPGPVGGPLPGTDDPHDADDPALQDEVLSVAFWFDAVGDHLRRGLSAVTGTDARPADGAAGDVPPDLTPEAVDRLLTVLANYAVGELTALDGASGLVRQAGDRRVKTFLATQTLDEARHLEVFVRRIRSLGVADPDAEIERRAHPALLTFRERLLSLVDEGDWASALFAQNVILESMERTVFDAHRRNADLRTRVVLDGVIADERRHLGFGENDLGRRLRDDDTGRLARRLAEIRSQLDPLVAESFDGVASRIGLAPAEAERLSDDYESAVRRLGLV